ncbi:MAG: TonB-dependent receptor [Henriciella sp.]|nr:TonB-dependent receptor [Henriciella sp.]
MTYKKTLNSTGLIAAIAILAPVSLAQVSPNASDGAEEADKRLGTVTVTAQKRVQDVQDVPISISAYSGEFLEESGAQTLQDIALYSPNFLLPSSSQLTNARIQIRGVGSVGNAGIEPSVGVFIDEVYYPRPGSILGNLLDVETVEVLRGPQGTLFGRNTAAGALNIRTKDPSLSGNSADLSVGAGNFDSYNGSAVFNGVVSDNVAVRLAAQYSERGGYGTNLLDGQEFGARDDLILRGKVLFNVNDQLTVKLAADYSEINFGGQTVELLADTIPTPAFGATLGALFGATARDGLLAASADPFDHEVFQDHRDFSDDSQWGAALHADYDFASGHVLRSITSFRDWEASNFGSSLRFPAQLFPRSQDFENNTFSQELQLLSPSGGAFEYVVGGFYYDESYDILDNSDLGAQFCNPVVAGLAGIGAAQACAAGQQEGASEVAFSQDLQSYAVFGQGTYRPSEQWAFTLGLRWTDEEKDGEFTSTINNPFVTALSIRSAETLPKTTLSDDQFTYFANASWFPVDDVMVFGTYSTGYKGGGFNTQGTFPALTPDQRIFEAETSDNFEIGIKSQFFDNTLQANVTAYRMDLEGFQDRAFDGISFITRNVGELRQQGIEADVIWAPLDQLTINGGLSFLDSEFLDYENASPLPGGPVQDLTGGEAHFSPDVQGSLVADWSDSLGFQDMDYFLRAEMQYIGEQNVGANTNNNPQTIQEAYSLLNARVGLAAPDNSWRLTLWGKNLTEEGYCTSKFSQPFGGSLNATANLQTPQRCVVGAPRTYGVELKKSF